MKRVNVGCGANPTPGWINYDNSPSVRLARYRLLAAVLSRLGLVNKDQERVIHSARDNGILWADATAHIPLPDASVDVLYSSHMVEHLDRERAMSFLAEVRRVLVSNGVLRIAVPDLKKLVAEYLERGDADALIDRTMLTRAKPKGLLEKLKYLVVGERHHQWMYDGKSMVRLLNEAGFGDPQILPPGSTLIKDPGSLDLWERKEESVYVEALNKVSSERSPSQRHA